MSELIRFMPYDDDNRSAYPDISEYLPGALDVIHIRQGTYKMGLRANRFVSPNFAACSGFILRDESQANFGFLHALPTQDLYEYDFEHLKELAGGQFIVVEGSSSTSKIWIVRDFQRKLGMKQVDTITVDTIRPKVGNMHFHVSFRPQSNELLVVRRSHEDLLVYKVF